MKLGTADISKIYLGITEVTKAYLGGTLVHGGTTPVLPYDAQVQYLRSSGAQWFDMGLKLTNNSEVEMVYASRSNSTNIFGCRASANSKNFMGSIGGANNNITLDFNNSSYSPYRILATNFPASKVKIIVNKDIRRVINLDTGATAGENTTVCNDVFTCDTNAYLLSASGNPYYTTKFACDLYYCKVRENGVLVRDFIPVRVGQVGYLYDNVSGQLFSNQGTGSFVLGADKGDYDCQVAYLHNDSVAAGAVYFITDYYPNTKTRVVLTCNVTATQSNGRFFQGGQNPLLLEVFQNTVGSYAYNFNTNIDRISTSVSVVTGTTIVDIDGVAKTLKIDARDTQKVNLSNIIMPASYTENDYRLLLFGSTSACFKINVIGCEIYDDGVKVRDYIAVKKDGVGCLYESITKTFIYNSGSASLTIGPDI